MWCGGRGQLQSRLGLRCGKVPGELESSLIKVVGMRNGFQWVVEGKGRVEVVMGIICKFWKKSAAKRK